MTKPQESLPLAPAGEADAAYYNLWLRIDGVKDGVMTNQACAKLAFGEWLEPGEPIVFEIISGSAVFEDGSQKKIATTDSFGLATLTFADTNTDSGEMLATMQNDPSVSSKAPYAFTGSTGYNLVLLSIKDGEPADGTSEDQGRAVVTHNGGALQAAQVVQFQFENGASARFDVSRPDVQPGSTDTVLQVKTHFDASSGHDIADAWLTDEVGETVTVEASLVGDTALTPQTLDFRFIASQTYEIALNALTDGQPADGNAEDAARAVVTQNGGALTEPQIAKFEFMSGAASFDITKPNVVQSLSDSRTLYVTTHSEKGQDIADACFSDTQAEKVEVRAFLYNHPEVKPKTLDFTFATNETYHIGLSSLTDNQPADGNSENAGQAVVTENGGRLTQPQIVRFEFDSGTSARFDTTKPAGYVQPNSSSTVLYVKTHFDNDAQEDIAEACFADNVAEAVTLTACLDGQPQTQPQTQGFEFTAPRTYFLGLSSMTPDGVPADGISENMAQAIVSCNGSGLPGPQTVKFELQGEGAFDMRGADVLPGSTGSTLYVKTHNDGRQDVAYAYFTAPWSGTTTLQASLPDHPKVEGRSVDFTFRSPSWPYAIALSSLTLDGVPADGKSENHAQVVVTYGGKPMGHTLVTFELDGAWAAKFDTDKPYVQSSSGNTMTVSTYVDEQGRDVADAFFTDTSAERVMLKASFPEYIQQGGSPAWRYFFFSTNGDEPR